jgi:hypothetical protein
MVRIGEAKKSLADDTAAGTKVPACTPLAAVEGTLFQT